MKIQVLIENTTNTPGIIAEHGLSFYIETGSHKILFDMGQSAAFAQNAKMMGVDLSQVDIAILSHGHYDHGGGLPEFLSLNEKAMVYVSRYAGEPHFSGERDIGLAKGLIKGDRFRLVDDTLQIDEQLSLVTFHHRERPFPMDCSGLKMKEKGQLIPEDFRHEQYLLIREKDKNVLISGCSHKGILNIMSWIQPDVLVGGFHFMKWDPASQQGMRLLENAAQNLLAYKTRYYTCHCTGQAQYTFLKDRMGEKLSYLSAADVIHIS